MWPVVRGWLPEPPARVLEIGCGTLGGFVPMLRSDGYDALGVDPEAPDGEDFRRIEFERLELPGMVDAVVASTSLHHVADPADVIDRALRIVDPAGCVVVIEWDWEAFDQPTAEWCFARLGADEEAHWLRRHRDEWNASGESWSDYLRGWARNEHIHAAGDLVRLLDERLRREHVAQGAYFFADLAETSEADERAAIDAGGIRATRVDYVGRPR